MANTNQYFFLVDYIKLSLLERERTISLNAGSTSQDGYISQSLESLREGIEKIENEKIRLENSTADYTSASQAIQEIEKNLRAQYEDLLARFRSTNSETYNSSPIHINDIRASASLMDNPRGSDTRLSTSLKTSIRGCPTSPSTVKTVRFSESPTTNQDAFFPYQDYPSPKDHLYLDNQKLHNYHREVIAQQDQVLNQLGESIERQRELSIQMGGELDDHMEILDGVDRHVDRHQTRLKQTMRHLETAAKDAKNNTQLRIIVILIIILVLLIIILNF